MKVAFWLTFAGCNAVLGSWILAVGCVAAAACVLAGDDLDDDEADDCEE